MRADAFVHRYDENKIYDVTYYLTPTRWSDNPVNNMHIIAEENWSLPIKYMNDAGDDVSDEIKNLPNNIGGIYIFIIKGVSIPFAEFYLAYIGRCKCTDHQNIRKRAKEYFAELNKLNPRPKIFNLLKYWKNYLFFRYYPASDNTFIDRTENNLIRAVFPPFNDEIPDKIEFEEPVDAF